MNTAWLLRMARWARRPPSARRVALVFGVVLVCLALAGAEWMGWLPDWFGLQPRGGRMPRF